MATYRYILHGRVQGVGFRYFAARAADAFDIRGWVRNRSDGTVEILAQGSLENIRAFREQIEIGPRSSRVDRVEAEERVEESLPRFDIVD